MRVSRFRQFRSHLHLHDGSGQIADRLGYGAHLRDKRKSGKRTRAQRRRLGRQAAAAAATAQDDLQDDASELATNGFDEFCNLILTLKGQ